MRFALSLAVLAVGLMVGSAEAGTYHSIGQGTLSCGTWISVRRYGQDLGYGQWVLGFLSGVGFMGNGYDPLNRLDAEGVWAWIDNYCLTHPLENIAEAGAAFVSAHPQ